MPKRQRLSKDQRRQAIVEAAAALFAERGFRGVTTRELAKAVGVTEPVLYEHFKTKRDLYSAIIDRTAEAGFEEAKAQLERAAITEEPREFFTKLGLLVLEHFRKDPAYMRLILFSALEKHELAELCFERHAMFIHRLVANYVQERFPREKADAVDPLVAARAFLGMVMQYVLFDLHFGFRIVRTSQKRTIATMVEIFLNGLDKK
jgi:AcrR family transcriptional regulator